MIMGFSAYGQGSGSGPVQYLTAERSPDGTLRTPPPEVLRGHPELVRQTIDALKFRHKYTSGVLSFAESERVVTPELQRQICEDFENIAFAGLSRDQYSILWVKHTHTGRLELNFLIPRVELSTGKSLNIAPPVKASRELFDTFRSYWNARLGLADPEDITRAKEVSLPNVTARLRKDAERKGLRTPAASGDDIRERITEVLRREVDAGRITNRADVVKYLQAQGYTLPRISPEYLSVTIDPSLPSHRGHIRLRGGLYREKDWNPRDMPTPAIRYGVPDPARAAMLREQLDRLAHDRATYHRTRYRPRANDDHPPEQREEREPPTPGQEVEPLEAHLRRTLGNDAIAPSRDGDDDPPAPSTRRRQRRQRIERAEEQMHRGDIDRAGKGARGRRGAPGAGTRRARQRFNRALGASHAALAGGRQGAPALAAAGERLGTAGRQLAWGDTALRDAGRGLERATTRFAAASQELDRQWWKHYYGERDVER